MTDVELAALGILLFSAALLVVLAVVNDLEDRRELDPPLPAPPPEQHQPRHADWGPTTRLRPPRD